MSPRLGSHLLVQGWSHALFGIFHMLQPTTATGLISCILYTSTCLITLQHTRWQMPQTVSPIDTWKIKRWIPRRHLPSRMKKRPNGKKLFPVPKWNNKSPRTKRAHRMSTIQWYTNIPALASSKFTSCCIMRNLFSSVDTSAKTAPKRKNKPIQRSALVLIADHIASFGMSGRFWMSTWPSVFSGCSSFNTGSWLRRVTGPLISRRHFRYIDQMIQLLLTNATVSKCWYHRIYPLATLRMMETSKRGGCDPPDKMASLSRMRVFQCTNFHL